MDTNIAVHVFKGNYRMARELDKNRLYMSTITRIELLAWKDLDEEMWLAMQNFISRFELIRRSRISPYT